MSELNLICQFVFRVNQTALFFLEGDFAGDVLGLTGDASLPFAEANTFCTATLSVKRFNGSLLSSFSNSTGVY